MSIFEILILTKTAFYKFDDNGAGSFPRFDISRGEYSYKEHALRTIEKIKKTRYLNLAEKNN